MLRWTINAIQKYIEHEYIQIDVTALAKIL